MTKINDDALCNSVDNWEKDAPIQLLLDLKLLKEYMREVNGIDYSWLGEHKIVDEKKYTMFLLRWS